MEGMILFAFIRRLRRVQDSVGPKFYPATVPVCLLRSVSWSPMVQLISGQGGLGGSG